MAEEQVDVSKTVSASCALGHRWTGKLVELPRRVKATAEGSHRTIVQPRGGGRRRLAYVVRNVIPCMCPHCGENWTSYRDIAHGG